MNKDEARERLYEHLLMQLSELEGDEMLWEQANIERMLFEDDLTIGGFAKEPIEQYLRELIIYNHYLSPALTPENVANALNGNNPSDTVSCLLRSSLDG